MARGAYRRRGTEQARRAQEARLADHLLRDIKGIRSKAHDYLVEKRAETSVAIDIVTVPKRYEDSDKKVFRSLSKRKDNVNNKNSDNPPKESITNNKHRS
jgi:hypothetical protein